mmetsp:Transcript_26196/g.67593  ORF Transcript_26196/g.67593 Transcript_26196/m.67593 type:complete len:204 (-) Transcript_26196:2220-2831(-)
MVGSTSRASGFPGASNAHVATSTPGRPYIGATIHNTRCTRFTTHSKPTFEQGIHKPKTNMAGKMPSNMLQSGVQRNADSVEEKTSASVRANITTGRGYTSAATTTASPRLLCMHGRSIATAMAGTPSDTISNTAAQAASIPPQYAASDTPWQTITCRDPVLRSPTTLTVKAIAGKPTAIAGIIAPPEAMVSPPISQFPIDRLL